MSLADGEWAAVVSALSSSRSDEISSVLPGAWLSEHTTKPLCSFEMLCSPRDRMDRCNDASGCRRASNDRNIPSVWIACVWQLAGERMNERMVPARHSSGSRACSQKSADINIRVMFALMNVAVSTSSSMMMTQGNRSIYANKIDRCCHRYAGWHWILTLMNRT